MFPSIKGPQRSGALTASAPVKIPGRIAVILFWPPGLGTNCLKAGGPKLYLGTCTCYFTISRKRKVTICARVQGASGENIPFPVPEVTPLPAAQVTASA